MYTGRNDPCPCGSGKKYKKCCLQSDTSNGSREISRSESMLATENSLRKKLEKFMSRHEFRKDHDTAWEIFWNEDISTSMYDTDIPKYSVFAEWFIHEYKLAEYNVPLANHFYQNYKYTLPSDEEAMLEDWLNAFYGVFEVQSVSPGAGALVKDMFSDEEYFINDVSLSRYAVKNSIICMHILPFRGKYYASGAGFIVPPFLKEEMIAYLDKKYQKYLEDSKESPTIGQFTRTHSHILNHLAIDVVKTYNKEKPLIHTTEGHRLLFSKSEFDVHDYRALKEFLDADKGMFAFMGSDEKIRGGLRYDYQTAHSPKNINFKSMPDDGRMHITLNIESDGNQSLCLGNLTLTRKKLYVECMSKERLDNLANILSGLERSGAISRTSTVYEDPTDSLGSGTSEDDEEEANLEEEVMPDGVKKAMSDHFEKYTMDWLDTPIPALDNMTPKEAAKTPAGKKELKELLKTIEYLYDLNKKNSRPYMNVPKIKKILGIGND